MAHSKVLFFTLDTCLLCYTKPEFERHCYETQGCVHWPAIEKDLDHSPKPWTSIIRELLEIHRGWSTHILPPVYSFCTLVFRITCACGSYVVVLRSQPSHIGKQHSLGAFSFDDVVITFRFVPFLKLLWFHKCTLSLVCGSHYLLADCQLIRN